MSKLSFRARALDATKPLPIYHAVDLPDLSEYNTINRTVPQMPTGMEKEEETERHLQDVILAQQTNAASKHIVIPTPENAINVPYYNKITVYVDKPSHYIRLPGLSLDEEVPDYDLDSEDEEWLSLQTNEKPLSCLHFERMMDKLEKGSGNTVLSEREAQALLKDDEDLVLAVYDYWLAKRLRLGRALIPAVKQERRDGTANGSNPYLAFRKRTEKMQTRKNRKNDETAYMQMQKLKRDLDKAFAVSSMVKERELKKHQLAEIHMDIFKKRYLLSDWSGSIMSSLCPVATRSATSRQNSTVNDSSWDGKSVLIKVEGSGDYDVHQVGRHEVLVSSGLRRKRKKKFYFPSSSLESPLPLVPSTPDKMILDPSRDLPSEDKDIDGRFTFKRKPYVKYHVARDHFSDWPWSNPLDSSSGCDGWCEAGGGGSDGETEYSSFCTRARMPKPKKFRFSRLTMSGQYMGLCRKRIGRGARVMFDRINLPFGEEDLSNDMAETMDTEPSHTTTSSLYPSPLSSNHTPSSSPHIKTTPTLITRRQSEILSTPRMLTEGKPCDRLLMRSQSVQAVSGGGVSSPLREGGGPVVETSESIGGGDSVCDETRESLKGVVKQETPMKSFLHFVEKTPSQASEFNSSHLPYIKQVYPLTPGSLEGHLNDQDFHPTSFYATDNYSFRRLPSFSDYREEMMTFSSLPTSHFTLRPSSSDTELEESPLYWNKSHSGGRLLDSESWNWNHPNNSEMRGEKNWQRLTVMENTNTSTYPHTFSAPSNYGSNLFHGQNYSRHNKSSGQQVLDHEDSVDSSTKDRSRSSLSVTDSKTIILTNTPAPWHTTGDKKREGNKVLANQQNHKLVGNVSQLKPSVLPPSQLPLQGEESNTNTVSGSNLETSVSGNKKSTNGDLERLSGGNGETQLKNGALVAKEQPGATIEQTKIKTEDTVATTTDGVDTSDIKKPTSALADCTSESSDNTEKRVEADEKNNNVSEKSPKEVNVLSLKGPASGVLLLNVHSSAKKDKANFKKSKKNSMLTGATLESALSITSQFVEKVAKKKDDMANLDILPHLGGILVRSSSGSRSGSSTPTILSVNDLQTQQKWAGIGNIGAAVSGIGASKLVEIQIPTTNNSPQSQETTVPQGTDVKRTNFVSDGIASHVTSQVGHVSSQNTTGVTRHSASPGTNGTNFQELFNSTKRKLSESTERGLKQALAGTVMNHNSLLENAAKPLVLKNSSEVT